jgi:purine-binding chemotaxis protein CheW
MGERQLVLFELEDTRYALDIAAVESIEAGLGAAPLPGLPEPFAGVASLHGRPLPVIDMRLQVGLPPLTAGDATRVVVVTVGKRRMGLMVDRVSVVARVQTGAIRPFPASVLGKMLPFVTNVVQMPDGLVFLVDVARLLPAGQKSMAAGAGR